jgi:hypothetical protein
MAHFSHQAEQFGNFNIDWDYNDGTGFFTIRDQSGNEELFKWPSYMKVTSGGKKGPNRIAIITDGITKRILEDLSSDQLNDAYKWMRSMMLGLKAG